MGSQLLGSSGTYASPGRLFTGESLREIAFPLGGIGTGTVSLGGRGQLRDWELFNHPGKGCTLPYSFFALWVGGEDRDPFARVLERRFLPPYSGGFGLPAAQVAGLPRFPEVRFRGSYPFAAIEFLDDVLPVAISLEAFNPFIPLNADDSGLPLAIFFWTVVNCSDAPVEVAIAGSLFNAAGYDGLAPLSNRRHAMLGGNRNEFVETGGLRGLRMSTARYPEQHPQHGTMALATPWPEVTFAERWERAGWWDDLQSFWDDFSADGRLPDRRGPDESPDGETDVGSLGLRARLEPGETARLPFLLAWHFPNLTNSWNRDEGCRGAPLGNYYATRHADAWAVAAYAAPHLERLERETRLFHDTLHGSTLPEPVLDAVSSQMSVIRTTTCIRTADGRFHAFEGCGDTAGCCPLDCTHVWNYEQALAHLFPDLERSMRLTDFGVNTRPDGRMVFRTLLPLAEERLWGGPPAADGQMGSVLKLYREWQLSGDSEFLAALWPHARSALEFAWQRWDRDQDGVMEGEQHNTYDIEFYGPNTMCGTLYLAALVAAGRMARAVGEGAFAAECEFMASAGAEHYDAELWNGEFYVQQVVAPEGPPDGLGEGVQSLQPSGELRYQYGPGCLSDQLLGQWWARVVGLGDVLPPDHVRSALAAIVRHNFRADFSDHANCQRIYALNDEAGLLLCSWPNGGRPAYPFPYADEVWTGIEYQVAAHCLYEGLLDEGLKLVKAVRDRYDGGRRNPWDEVECGHHYARALSSWSLLLALSGYEYSAPDQSLGFAPRLNQEDFRCFFSSGSGWGRFTQHSSAADYEAEIVLYSGGLRLRTLRLASERALEVTLDGERLESSQEDGMVVFEPSISLTPGQVLRAFGLARVGVPAPSAEGKARVISPRLGCLEQSTDFLLEVEEEDPDGCP